MENQKLARNILQLVGGKQNVKSVIHCATRMRFKLKDDTKAKTDNLKSLDGVIEVVQSGGQYQIVIGSQVKDVYNALIEEGHFEEEGSDTEKSEENLLSRIIDIISGIFLPFVGIMAGAGVLKGFLALAVTLNWLSPESGTYRILFIAADAFFQYLPFPIAVTAGRKFKVDPFISVAIAASLLHPDLTAGALNFIGIDVVLPPIGYFSSVLPIILAVAVQIPVERFFKKFVPSFLQTVVTPLLTLTVMVPLSLVLIGPIGTIAGNSLGKGYMAITELSPLIAGLVIGALWQVLVIFGMHWGLVPVTINNLATLQFDTFTPLILPPVIAQGGAALAVMLKTKDKKKKQLAGSGALTALFGITEPTIYGVTLPQKKPFIAGCIGGAIGGGLMGVMGVKAFSQVMPSILVLPAFISTVDGVQSSLMWAVISVLVAFVSAFVLTLIMDIGSTETVNTAVEEQVTLKNGEKEILVSPMTGKVTPLSDVEDAVFASEAMGKGLAILPEIGELKAPAAGVITTVFPTGHAIGMTTDLGAEILMHIGIDTVELEGQGFEKHVEQGDTVVKGQLLVTFDIALLEKQGKGLTSPIVITNSSDYLDVLAFNQTELVVGEDCLTLIK